MNTTPGVLLAMSGVGSTDASSTVNVCVPTVISKVNFVVAVFEIRL